MAKCKDCLHLDVCNGLYLNLDQVCERKCRYFKKRSDYAEVIHCKDCKHCTVTSDGMVCECAIPTKQMMDYYIYGSTILAKVEADDFCSHGERKDNG